MVRASLLRRDGVRARSKTGQNKMTDYVIVGGGVIGLLLARELAGEGASVTVVDKGACGAEASWAGGGIVSPLYPWRYAQPVTALAQQAQRAYPALARALYAETGIDPEWEQTGLLMLDADDASAALQWAGQVGSRMEALSPDAIYAREAGLAPGFEHGLWMPDIANIRNPRLLKALLVSVRAAKNVSVLEQARVTGFALTQQGDTRSIQGVHIEQAGRSALVAGAQVVIAAGAWSASLLTPLEVKLPIAPVKGQMLLYKLPSALLRSIVLTNGRYLIPRRDNHLLVGSTLEHTAFDKSTTAEALASLQASACALLPALAAYPVMRHWAGLRPGTPAGVPFIGRVPGFENLYLNAGQYRNGLVLAPASASLLADMLLGRTSPLDPRPYALVGRNEAL